MNGGSGGVGYAVRTAVNGGLRPLIFVPRAAHHDELSLHWAGSPSRCLAQAKDDGGRPSQGGARGSGQDRPQDLSASPTTHDPIAKREGCCSAQWTVMSDAPRSIRDTSSILF
jgi:hypothetical protein